MTNQNHYYYYGEDGTKIGPVTPAAIQMLAQQGLVLPLTMVANSKGQTTLACNLGLSFPESLPEEESVSFDVWLSGLVSSWLITLFGVIILLIIGNVTWVGLGVNGHAYLDAIFGKNSYVHILFLSGESDVIQEKEK